MIDVPLGALLIDVRTGEQFIPDYAFCVAAVPCAGGYRFDYERDRTVFVAEDELTPRTMEPCGALVDDGERIRIAA